MFRFSQTESLLHFLKPPLPGWTEGFPFLWLLGPASGMFNWSTSNGHLLCLFQRKVEAAFQSLVWAQHGPQFPGLAEIVVDGTSSWTFSQACWYKPISLNQYLGTLLSQVHEIFLASMNIETPLTCGSATYHQWAHFRQGSLLRSRFLRVHILNFRALSLSCSWLTHATTPTLPIILSYITSVLLLHTTPCMFFNFLFVESAVLSYISAWIYWRSGWLDSYVAKFRGPADMRNSTPQSYNHLKLLFKWA